MKQFLAVIVLVLALRPDATLAHVLKADGSIGAVMHISPDDDPIVGQPAAFYFEIKDKQAKFRSEKCDCTFAIYQGDKELVVQNLFQGGADNGLANAQVNYTFLEKNVYQIRVSGRPRDVSDFQPFNLVYSIRVDRGVGDPPPKRFDGRLVIFGVAVSAFLALAARSKLRSRLIAK